MYMKRALVALLGVGVMLSASIVVDSAYALAAIPTPSATIADISSAKSDACAGIGVAGSGCGDNGSALSGALTAIINVFAAIVGVVAVIMIIIAGMRFITSGGDTSKVASAKSAITYAIIGLIIVAAAESIVHFVLGKVGG